MVARERRRIESERGVVICDTRYLPIVVMQWRGETDLELIERFGRWMNELLQALEAEDRYAATIVDLTHVVPPSSEIRRALVELRHQHLRRSKGRVVIDVIATSRPALRGLIQALSWINPRAPAVAAVSLGQALRRCRTALERAGIAAPSVRAEEFEEPS
ncbi:MAG: hypothetical protein R6X02_20885 [Enhygromyxa sp.]